MAPAKKTNNQKTSKYSKKDPRRPGRKPKEVAEVVERAEEVDEGFLGSGENLTPEERQDIETQIRSIVRSRKIDPALIRRLIPKARVLNKQERERYTGIVKSFLADFRQEEPTASDLDDILEIAKCDIMETRLLEASKNDPGTLVAVSQALERIYKRKQKAKENLASRRADRKESREGSRLTIMDIVAAYENHRRELESKRLSELEKERRKTYRKLRDIIRNDAT